MKRAALSASFAAAVSVAIGMGLAASPSVAAPPNPAHVLPKPTGLGLPKMYEIPPGPCPQGVRCKKSAYRSAAHGAGGYPRAYILFEGAKYSSPRLAQRTLLNTHRAIVHLNVPGVHIATVKRSNKRGVAYLQYTGRVTDEEFGSVHIRGLMGRRGAHLLYTEYNTSGTPHAPLNSAASFPKLMAKARASLLQNWARFPANRSAAAPRSVGTLPTITPNVEPVFSVW